MKIDVTERIVLISDYSPQEEKFLKKHLSWGELSYNVELSIVELGNLPVTIYSDKPNGYQKTKSVTIMLAKLPDGRLYTIKHALYYVLKNFGSKIKFDFSKIEEKESLPRLGKIDPNYLPGITLRDYQESTINKALAHGSGIVKSAVGSGKTEMQICLSGFIVDNDISDYVLIVCPSLALVENFYERCKKYGIQSQMFTSGCKIDEKIRIIVANIDAVRNQFSRNGKYVPILKKCRTVIVDEAHHLRADTFFQMIISINPTYLYEFSGTPFQDNDYYSNYADFLVFALCGKIVSSVTTAYLIERGFLAKPYLLMLPVGKAQRMFMRSWHTVENNYIIKNKERNQLIVQWVEVLVKYKMKIMIILRALDHMDLLLKMLYKAGINAVGIKGSRMGRSIDEVTGMVEEYDISYEAIFNRFRNGEFDVLIANQVADEGIDVTSVNVLLLAGGSKSFVKTNQRTGRGLRAKKEGLNETFIIDFMDNGHPYVHKHSILRKEYHLQMGATELNNQQFIDRVYQNYLLRTKKESTQG